MKHKKEIEDILAGINQKLKGKYVQTHYPSLYEDILNFCDTDELRSMLFKQKFYHYYNDLKNLPNCPSCNKKIERYRSFIEGYSTYCNAKCAAVNPLTKEKRKVTTKEIYGVSNVFQSESIKGKMQETNLEKYGATNPNKNKAVREKIKQTNLERYGSEIGPGFNSKSLSKEIWSEARDKAKETNLERYGSESFVGTEQYMSKVKETCLEKYGTEHWTQSDLFKEKIYAANIDKALVKFKDKGIQSTDLKYATFLCSKCNKTFTETFSFIKQRNCMNMELCTHCNPYGFTNISGGQQELIDFIKEHYNGKIDINTRRVITPNEIDIFLEELNLGIEYNGLYWHSELVVHKEYHVEKTIKTQGKGVQLIQVFEDEWKLKKEIVKSRILYMLGGIKEKYFARKCQVKEVSTKEEREFLNVNHLQGYVASKHCYGLFIDNQLVSLMSFSLPRSFMGKINPLDNEWELLRYCSKLNTNVIGGAGKLYKHFIKEVKPSIVYSYADARWSEGNLYKNLGMVNKGLTKPNYTYAGKGQRENRFLYRKDVLVKEGFDATKTEHEIMLERGYFRVYDCGSYKFEQTFNNP